MRRLVKSHPARICWQPPLALSENTKDDFSRRDSLFRMFDSGNDASCRDAKGTQKKPTPRAELPEIGASESRCLMCGVCVSAPAGRLLDIRRVVSCLFVLLIGTRLVVK